MSLQFILGEAGSGQSEQMIRELIGESIARPEGKYIVLVPEQFTLQTQRRLVSSHPRGGILNIDVLSFERLAQRVLEGQRGKALPVLTETGKNLILRRIALKESDRLTLFRSSMDRQGMVESVKSILSEFEQYEITPDSLQEMIESVRGNALLEAKLKDLKVLYEAYGEYRREKYITGEELLGVFASLAGRSEELKDAVLVLDEFTGFTPVQMTAMRSILKTAAQVRISLVLPERERWEGRLSESDFYYLSKKTIRGMYRLCREEGVEILSPRYAAAAPKRARETVIEAATPFEEAQQAAGQIRRLIAEKGVRPRQIGVIVSDMAVYEHYIARSFGLFGIPFFMDHKVAAGINPCPELVRAVFELAEKNWRYDSVMRLLRTGFAPLETDGIDRLENYLLATGIRGRKKWENPWEKAADALRRLGEEERAAALEELNGFRRTIRECLSGSMEGIGRGKAKVREYVKAVRTLFSDLEVEKTLLRESERFEDLRGTPMLLPESERLAKAMEYRQMYGVMDNILTEADTLLGSETVSRSEFLRILEAGLSEAKIGLIPPGLDEVYVGDLERTRLMHPKILFLLGANDGKIPARREKTGILSEADREVLQERDYELAPGLRRDIYTQRFYLHLVRSRPEEEMRISYALSDSAGAPLRPSYLVAKVRERFSRQEKELPGTAAEGLSRLARALGEAARTGVFPDTEKQMLRAYLESDRYRSRVLSLLRLAGAQTAGGPLKRETAEKLYGNVLLGSVSRFDAYARCPFAHFAEYGLRLREREKYQVRTSDIGTLLHDALRLYFEKIRPQDLWKTISPERQRSLAHECLQEAADRFGKDIFSDGGRARYTYQRSEQILQTTLQAMMYQLQAGSFAPQLLEYRFDTGLKTGIPGIVLPEGPGGAGEVSDVCGAEGGRIRLVGQIDRLDVAAGPRGRSLKIIDYKSGTASFSLASIYDGRGLQLPVYLNQAVRQMRSSFPGERIIPAGLYYCHLDDPLVSERAFDALQAERKDESGIPPLNEQVLKMLKPDGLTNHDPEVLSLFAEDEAVRKQIIPVPSVDRKTGELKADSPTASEEQLLALGRFADRKLRENTARILGGDIRLLPYREKKRLACAYCRYASVCRYDPRLPDALCRPATEGKGLEILEKIMALAPDTEE